MNNLSLQAKRYSLAAQLLTGAGLALSVMSAQAQAAPTPVLKAYMAAFEPVATDAQVALNRAMDNVWGGHQSRITRDADGTIHLLYLQYRADTTIQWRLMRRSVAGVWTQDATGLSGDDVALLRDPRDERVYVVAYPDGTPYMYSGPTFAAVKVPGGWQSLFGSRHYGNAGIGPDGTICIKHSRENTVAPYTETKATYTDYACGSYTASNGLWSWGPLVTRAIGNRHSYDYLFPNPPGAPAPGLYATSSRDVYKAAATEVPNYDPSAFAYAFNGAYRYVTSMTSASDTAYHASDIAPPLPQSNPTAPSAAPDRRMTDSYMDSSGRTFTPYYQNDPQNAAMRALKIAIVSKDGSSTYLLDAGPTMPSYGPARVFEDSKHRIWALWGAAGSMSSTLRIYPLNETVTVNAATGVSTSTWAVGGYTDLSSAIYPYSQIGNVFLAVPRGGNFTSLYVDMIFSACNEKYGDLGSGVPFNSSLCYDPVNSKYQRVFYARIRLPD